MGFISAIKSRHAIAAVAIVLMVTLCLSLCFISSSAPPETIRAVEKRENFPNTMNIEGILLDYPDGFAVSTMSSSASLVIGEEQYSGRQKAITSDDNSIIFFIEVFYGVDFNELQSFILEATEKLDNGFFEPIDDKNWNLPNGYEQSLIWEDPELLTINGNRALLSVISSNNSEGLSVYSYYISFENSRVGLVRVAYTNKQYDDHSRIIDGVISSIRAKN